MAVRTLEYRSPQVERVTFRTVLPLRHMDRSCRVIAENHGHAWKIVEIKPQGADPIEMHESWWGQLGDDIATALEQAEERGMK